MGENINIAETDSYWSNEIRAILGAIDRARELLHALGESLSNKLVAQNVFPHEMPEPERSLVASLHQELQSVAGLGSDLFERLSARPLAKLVGGFPLTREEYYLLVAMGALEPTTKALGLTPVDDYEAFSFHHYEDTGRRAYINPGESPREPGKLQLRFGIAPEEVHLEALRPDQRDFFKKHLPTIYERFRRG